MDCGELATLTCELKRIADSMDAFDWNGFVGTLLATLIGAGVAALVSFLVFRGEHRERYEVALDDAATRTMTALHQYSEDYRTFVEQLTDWGAEFAKQGANFTGPKHSPPQPERAELDIALDVLIVKARGEDRSIAEHVKDLVYVLTFTNDPIWLRSEYQTVRRVIASWRAKRRTAKETLASLAMLEERRKLKQKDVPDEELPPSPEPYVRPGDPARRNDS